MVSTEKLLEIRDKLSKVFADVQLKGGRAPFLYIKTKERAVEIYGADLVNWTIECWDNTQETAVRLKTVADTEEVIREVTEWLKQLGPQKGERP